MKIYKRAQARANRRGFTLIEIMVVITIIGILLAITVPAVLSALNTAYRAKNTATCVSIKTAIVQYNADYGNLPVPLGITPPASGDTYLGAVNNTPPTTVATGTNLLFQALCGNVNPYTGVATTSATTGLNTRNTPYLSLQKSNVDSNGVALSVFKVSGASAYFGLAMDTDYNNQVVKIPDCVTTGSLGFNGTDSDTVAVWCCNDQTYSTPNQKWSHSW